MSERFLGYERDQLDRQYDLIALQGEGYAVYRGLFESLSRQTYDSSPAVVTDVDCGEGLILDVFPAPDSGAPILLFLQGGMLGSRSRRDGALVARGLVPGGCAVAVADGCLLQDGQTPAAIDNARRAVLWLRDHAGELNGDPARLFVVGQGLGAVPAALTLTADWSLYTGNDDPMPPPVAGLAAISGVFDLEPVRRCFLNNLLQLDAAMAMTHAPVRLAASLPEPRPVIWLAVGERETDEYHRQMAAYGTAAEQAGCAVTASTRPGHNHFSLVAELADPSSVFTKELIAMVRGHAIRKSDPI